MYSNLVAPWLPTRRSNALCRLVLSLRKKSCDAVCIGAPSPLRVNVQVVGRGPTKTQLIHVHRTGLVYASALYGVTCWKRIYKTRVMIINVIAKGIQLTFMTK